MDDQSKKRCLAVEPFEGGKGEDNYRPLRDGFVFTRKVHDCALCWEPIAVGAEVRAKTELDLDPPRRVRTFHFCPTCCTAMAASWSDNGLALEERFRIGIESARQSRAHDLTVAASHLSS